ncbi:GGDEF domain-containing protein [Ectopseudomonas mendocina]|uniref:sensor domain-containing diguanylate cyclase n=1 Tax=Ectopseudomonas mendocina TaxID=300 RepID=UPI001ADFAC77|nr:diguanylate cyclase [Pseudomonas mendocina]MDF2077631.1 sensor domain-containing diguanylate cyclase [Pseudomonas mendocina]QTN45623.1 GGDEF domain-containing protein [Pseudomonas mendocina]
MNAHHRLRLSSWLLLGLLLLSLSTWADSRQLDIAQPSQQPLSLTTHVGLLEDTSRTLALEDIRSAEMAGRFRYEQASSASFALGFTRSAYWFRLDVGNSSAESVTRLLVVDNPRISLVDVYLPDEQGGYRAWLTGADRPQGGKAYDNRNFVFPLHLAAHSQQVVYLRVESSIGLLVPLQLWSEQAFHAYEREDYMARAGYMGIAIAMILFNLMLFIALRERIYLLYVTFVLCAVCTLTIKNGMAPDWTLFDLPLNSNVAYYSGASLALSGMLLFMRSMLQTTRLLPRVDRGLLALVALYLVSPLIYAVALPQVSRVAIVAYLLTAFVMMGVGLACALKRQRSAYFFLAAFGLLILGGATTTLRALGILPTNAFTEDGLQIGSSLEMLLLAFALADRINVMRQEKLQAQARLLEAQEQLVETLQHSERELEQRVAVRTEELQVLNSRLEMLSLTDALTGIANRRHFDEVLAKECKRALRVGEPLALAVLDVDWFKTYNDHYGHPAGDSCLQQIAHTLAATISRSTDLVARYGGEEFVFLAPSTGLAGAQSMAEKLVRAVEALALPHERSPLGYVTISVGIALMPRDADSPAQALLQRADAALYRAKSQGRNRVVCDGQA